MDFVPLIDHDKETIRQRLAKMPKPLLIVFLITLAITYYYEVCKAPKPQDPPVVSAEKR